MGWLYVEAELWLFVGILVLFWYLYRFVFLQDFWHKNIFSDILQSIYTPNWIRWVIHHCLILLSIWLFFLLLSSPRKTTWSQDISNTWIDIVLVLDLSVSMLATDFEPNRFEVAQEMLSEILDTLEWDRVGLVVFSWKPFVSLPLTFDYGFVDQTIQWLSLTTIDQSIRKFQWTAIGDALLSALSVLEKWRTETKERSQAIILLTDWERTLTTLDPILVAKKAKEDKVNIYTIGLGSPEWVILDVPQLFGSKKEIVALDEVTLQEIANITAGSYRIAKDNKSLEVVLGDIARLAKSTIVEEKNISWVPYRRPFLGVLLFCLILLWSTNYFWSIDEKK